MGLLSFLNKKPAIPEIKNLVWMSHKAKLKGCLDLLKQNPDAIFIAWFSNTQHEFNQFIQEQNGVAANIETAKKVSSEHVENKTVFFLEHHPLRNKEQALISDWKAKQIYVLNSLDEPLFENLGGNNIILLMQKMGMTEEESIENTLISKSIENAQRKIEQRLVVENSANSSADWFKRNIIN